MTRALACLLAILAPTDLLGDEGPSKENLAAQANAAYDAKNYAECAELYDMAFRDGAGGMTLLYHGACCYALAGNEREAFKRLYRAIDAGWVDDTKLANAPDLVSLHEHGRWKKTLEYCRSKTGALGGAISRPDLRKELLHRMAEDQEMRNAMKPGEPFDMEWVERIDGGNTAFMKEVIAKDGWPTIAMVGDDGAMAAWLLVQHADRDPQFQARCLVLMEKAVESNGARGTHFAYLTDRVLCAQGKPQIYGTQFEVLGGELRPKPIEDEANVDARRAKVGLSTLAQYAEQMRAGTP